MDRLVSQELVAATSTSTEIAHTKYAVVSSKLAPWATHASNAKDNGMTCTTSLPATQFHQIGCPEPELAIQLSANTKFTPALSILAIQREQGGLPPTGSIASTGKSVTMSSPQCVSLEKAKSNAICAAIAANQGMLAPENGETPAAFLKRYDREYGPRPKTDCEGTMLKQCARLALALGLFLAMGEPRRGLGGPSAAESCGPAISTPAARVHEQSWVRRGAVRKGSFALHKGRMGKIIWGPDAAVHVKMQWADDCSTSGYIPVAQVLLKTEAEWHMACGEVLHAQHSCLSPARPY